MADALYEKIKGLCRKSNRYDPKLDGRLKSELDLISEAEVLSNLWNLYRKTQEPGWSASKNKPNSMVAYVMGLTDQEPSGPFVFEKRRTYGRDGFPDIDMDFDHERRHEIIEYFVEKYGAEYVGSIGTVMRLKTKAALRRVIKALDPEDSVVYDTHGNKIRDNNSDNFRFQNEILNELPDIMKKADGQAIGSVKEAYDEFPNFRRYMDEYPDVYRKTQKLEGSISAYGSHAAGIIISPIPLARIAPLHVTRGEDKNKVVATQFTMSDVESLGLIKIDVLGLSTKTAIALAVQEIKEMHGVDVDIANLPLNDEATLGLLSSGKTDGCFQLENTGMKQALQQIGIHKFNDLVVAVAMYRPGPKDYIPEYSQRKRGVRQVRFPHELVRDITKDTYGIMCFQEQVMQVFMAMADLTATEGYTFMKGCAKKKTRLIEKFKGKFKNGCLKNKIPEEVINKVWTDMEKFGGYAFNRAHACSYAYESFKTAYLKAHYRLEFMSARLTVEAHRRNFDDVEKYEADCLKSGVVIMPPDLNKSKMKYTIVDEKTLRRPLLIKGVGDKAAEDIVKNQPYKGVGIELFRSFCMKAGSAINSKVIESLHASKLFGMKKKEMLDMFERIRNARRRNKGEQDTDLFS